VDEANTLVQFSTGILLLGRRMGVPVTLENPASSLMFHMPSIARLAALPGFSSAVCEYCMFGAPWRKSTKLIGFNIRLDRLASYRCIKTQRGLCARTQRPHQRLHGTEEGLDKTKIAQAYPRKFCRILSDCFIDAIAERKAMLLNMRLRS